MSGSLLSNLSTVVLSGTAVTLFQSATLIIGGHLAKDTLEPFYTAFPGWWQRMLIVLLPLPGIGNLLAASAFTNPFVAGTSFLVFTIWAALFSAAYIGSAQIDTTSTLLVTVISLLALLLGSRLS